MSRSGFTLLEAMVSLAILSLVGIAALGAVGRDLDAAGRARTALESAALAEDRLEVVRMLELVDLAAPPDSIARGRFAAPFAEYAWRTDVEPVADAPGLFDVRIDVLWGDGIRTLRARLYRPPPVGS